LLGLDSSFSDLLVLLDHTGTDVLRGAGLIFLFLGAVLHHMGVEGVEVVVFLKDISLGSIEASTNAMRHLVSAHVQPYNRSTLRLDMRPLLTVLHMLHGQVVVGDS